MNELNPSLKVIIDITGPGGCISAEALIIERCLKEFGYNIKVTNNYPTKIIDKDDFLKRAKENADKWLIEINVNHLPWGG